MDTPIQGGAYERYRGRSWGKTEWCSQYRHNCRCTCVTRRRLLFSSSTLKLLMWDEMINEVSVAQFGALCVMIWTWEKSLCGGYLEVWQINSRAECGSCNQLPTELFNWRRRLFGSHNHRQRNVGISIHRAHEKSIDAVESRTRTSIQKFRTQNSAGKLMLTVFWDCWGVIHQEYLSEGRNLMVNAERYFKTLFNLRTSIKNKRPSLLSRGFVFLHDNARPHVAALAQSFLKDFCWDVLPHPPYSPD